MAGSELMGATTIAFPAEHQRYREMAFCPRCGHAFAPGDFHAGECLYLCSNCSFDFYQNPLPASVVVLPEPMNPASILVLRRSTKPGIGLWCVPGGFIKYGETPAQAADREAREETGFEVDIGSVLRAGLVDYSYRGRQICIVEIAFVARLRGEATIVVNASSEASELRFMPCVELLAAPELLAFPEQAEVLRAYQARLAERGPVFP
jgi:ADP-ribose pyrophosphatase YjhB (NUDIX family)